VQERQRCQERKGAKWKLFHYHFLRWGDLV
jgi:hypothetical protein